jgi:FtsP/CotA-like multicopper oxidase with cupredoxin domain
MPRTMTFAVFRTFVFVAAIWTLGDIGARAAAELLEPPTQVSSSGKLDVLMVARPQFLPFSDNPAGYAYEICSRPEDTEARRCPIPGINIDLRKCPRADDPAVSPYGGVRLHLNPGDTLQVRLVNCLPLAVDPKHVQEDPSLKFNPTNLHTHGLIVEPRGADDKDDPFGDYIFVVDLAPGVSPPTSHEVSPARNDHARRFEFREVFVDYRILIPKTHPSGLFWFHPHVHGLSLNQVAGGLAGILTIGSSDQLCDPAVETCSSGKPVVRDLILKDVQITAASQVRFQENPAMCATPDADGQIGKCLGKGATPGTTEAGDDGRWEFTINGQSFPEMKIHPEGEVWRIANASASASYNLGFFPDGQTEPLLFQVLAIDGVSLVLPSGLTQAQANYLMGDKISVVPCPEASSRVSPAAGSTGTPPPVCANSLRMMPSARAEILIPGASKVASATLRTVHRSTGLDGDDWPNIDLAKITFSGQANTAREAPKFLSVEPAAARVFGPEGIFSGPAQTRLAGSTALTSVSALQQKSGDAASAARLKSLRPDDRLNCTPLPQGNAREILFGLPSANSDKFGLGYRANVPFDLSQQPSPPSRQEDVKIEEFNHSAIPTVCVQLGAKNSAVTENWILVNLAREDHNFHIHQTRFSLTSLWKDGNNVLPTKVAGDPVLLDNVPLPSGGDGCDGTVDAWISGACKPTFVTVSIPFHEVGDFVYHCHILEHEDGGMMAKITVIPHRQ